MNSLIKGLGQKEYKNVAEIKEGEKHIMREKCLTPMNKSQHISIIIPAYNEEERIGKTLDKIINHLKNKKKANKKKKKKYEIIIVDDGSKDNTSNICKEHIKRTRNVNDIKIRLLNNKRNLGKGGSVKRGILDAKGDTLLFSDADLSTPIEEMDKFLGEIKKEDIVIASRNMKESDIRIRQPFYRKIPGKIFSILTRALLLPGIKDSQCGFKMFTREAAKEIFPRQTINGFAFDIELLFIAKKKRLSIKEIPVTWINDEHSKVNIFKDPLIMLLNIIKIRINDVQKKYA